MSRTWFGFVLLVVGLGLVGCGWFGGEEEPTATPVPTVTLTATAVPPTPIPPTATPQIIGNVPADTAVSPRLISFQPAAGAEAAPNAVLELLFDQPMDEAQTAAALQVQSAAGEPISGEIVWPDDAGVKGRLLRFVPQAELAIDTQYTAVVDTNARSANGDPLLEPLTIPFQTIGNLEVSQVAPLAEAGNVSLDTAVTVIFNRPVVPLLTRAQQAELPNPLEISPAIAGSGEWVNTSVYVWRPDSGQLVDRTSYNVRVLADVVNSASTTGAQLLTDYVWQFTTTAPTVGYLELPGSQTNPRNGYEHLPLDQSFRVWFNQPMNTAVTESAITLVSESGGVPLQFGWNEENTAVTFTPTQLLPLYNNIRLTVANSAQSTAGGTIAEPFIWDAITVLPPAIAGSNPADGTTQELYSSIFTLRFVSPMSLAGLNGKVTFDPPISGDPNGYYDSWDWSARYFGLAPSTSYTVTISADMADPYGNTLGQEQVIRFTTARYTPSAQLQMVQPFALYRTGGNNNLWATYRNVNTLYGGLYTLTAQEFMSFAQPYAEVSPNYFQPTAEQNLWVDTKDLSADINVREYTNFRLQDTSGNELPPGFYFFTLNTPDIVRDDANLDAGLLEVLDELNVTKDILYGGVHLDARPIMLANANLTLKTTSTEALIWLTDLATGAPIPNVSVVLYDQSFTPIFQATTDGEGVIYQDGLTLTPDWQNRYYALTDDPVVFGAAVDDWEEGTSPYDFGIYTDYYLQPGQGMVYFYTDRPIYRPGQTVHFKGIVRLNDDLDFSLPEASSVDVRISSYDGLIASQTLELNEFGTFVGEVALDEEAVLGSYYVEIQMGAEYIGSAIFDVAEYRKPTFQVNVEPAAEEVLVGGVVENTAVAEFFSGGAVANSDVRWYASARTYIFNPGGNLNTYSFYSDNREYDGYNYYWGGEYGNQIAESSGTTDAQGRASWQLPAAPAPNSDQGESQLYTVEATITDIANNVVSGRAQVIVHAAEVYPGIKPSGSRIGQAGRETGFDVVLVDWAGTVIPNGTVEVQVVERRWSSVQEEDDWGNTIWRSEVEEVPVGEPTSVTLDENGRATLPFTPPTGGTFRAYARATDGRGNTAVSSTYLWVYGGDEFIPWRRTSDHGIELITNKDEFTPGETAEILIASPFQGESTALVTIERGHIRQHEVITLQGNDAVYRVPITGDMAPNIFVSVLIMKGVDETNPTPDFKIGMVQLKVDLLEQELNIAIEAHETVLGPRDTVTYTVRVTDFAGNPVEAELSAAVVDLAVLTLTERNSPPILDFFYAPRWLGVRTAVLLTQNMEPFNIELEEQLKGGGGGGDGFGVMTIREEFADTAYWNGVIRTDANGQATFAVRLPDNLTTWRLDVRAVTLDTLVGEATFDVQTTLPLLVNPQTPRFFIVGDMATVGTAVRNTTADDLTDVAVNFDAQGVALLTSDTQTITIPAYSTSYVTWDIVVEDVTRADFIFSAQHTPSGYGDASRPEIATLPGGGIPVYNYEVMESVGTSGQLLDGGVIVESIGLPHYENYDPSQGNLSVEIAPSLAAAMTNGLTYLEHYPYECTEQIISKFLPNAVTLQTLQIANISDPELQQSLDTQMEVALQRLYTRQNGDGGWPWWQGPSDTLVTAYVLHGLLEAEASGYELRPDVIPNAVNYLNSQLLEVDQMEGRFKYNRQAYITYVLARAGQNVNQMANDLYTRRATLDYYALALLGETLQLQDPSNARLNTIESDLLSAALTSASGTNWEEQAETHDYWNWNTDTRTTAMVLGFLAKRSPDNPQIANGVRWLMAHRTAGRWQGTQETAWSLLALNEWMRQSGELEADYAYEVGLNDVLLGQGTAVADTLREPLQLSVDIQELLVDELNRLVIGRTEGPGNLYYTSFLNVGLPVEEVTPIEDGFFISRAYYDPADRTTPVNSADLGDTLLVRLTIVVPNTRHYVIIDDPLPAGLEAIDASLSTSQQEGQPEFYTEEEQAQSGDFFGRGWGYWYFDNIQLKDEKVVIAAQYLPAGTYEYTYLARAATPGEFRTIPPTAQEFYFPDVYGRGSGMLFTVNPAE